MALPVTKRTISVFVFAILLAQSSFAEDQKSPHLYERVVALCIGINDYASPDIKDLQYAEPDAIAVADCLRQRYGYETDLLLGKQATLLGIGAKLRQYAKELDGNDALIIYFAVHGQVVELRSYGRAGFLIPQDAALDLSQTNNPDQWSNAALDMRQLVDMIGEMKAHHVLLIADACCSGFMTKRGTLASRKDLHLLLTEPSRVVVSASTEFQSAVENWKTGHGYFTEALIKQLEQHALEDEKTKKSAEAASVTDLFVEIRKQVSKESKTMLPQMANVSDGNGEFVFIPIDVPAYDVKLAAKGGAAKSFENAKRSLLQLGQSSTLEDVYEAFQAGDYRFSKNPREHEQKWEAKLERFEQNAQLGDVLAMAGLHYCYSKSLGVEKDEKAAIRWARLAYDSELPIGKHVYARCLTLGIGCEKNEEAARKIVEESAMAGFALSKLVAAQHYLSHRGEATDEQLQQAVQWLQEAADAGIATAKEQMAQLYLDADGVAGIHRDSEKALSLLKEAVAKGLPSSQFLLANISTGEVPGIAPDRELARTNLFASAEAGFSPAQHVLGEMYQSGNLSTAIRWYELAARQDHTPSLVNLAELYQKGPNIDPAKAKQYCERAVQLNDASAFVTQGSWYADGVIYKQDDVQAIELFRRAAQMKHANGCMMLGWMYENARGVELGGNQRIDMMPIYQPHALHWYIQAVILDNHAEARAKLKKFHEDVTAERTFAKQGIPWGELGAPTPSSILRRLRAEHPESAKQFDDMF